MRTAVLAAALTGLVATSRAVPLAGVARSIERQPAPVAQASGNLSLPELVP